MIIGVFSGDTAALLDMWKNQEALFLGFFGADDGSSFVSTVIEQIIVESMQAAVKFKDSLAVDVLMC